MRKPLKVILGMEEPACRLVARELVGRGGENPEEPSVVVVPTREAARLLKEQLAIVSAGSATTGAFVSPRIVQASQLVGHGGVEGDKTAPLCVSLFVWQSVLRKAEGWLAKLFPKTDDWHEEAWLRAAENMQQLFRTLSQEGVDIGGAAWQKLAAQDSRWEVLLTLRQRYLERLHAMGLTDADASPTLQLEPDVRVILACVPNLPKQAELLISAAPNLVEVWLPCEEPYAAWFDAWGRPGRQWLDTTDRDELGLSRPGWKNNLIVTGDAWALAAETARATARANAAGNGALYAVALGVCDPELEPAIAEEFALRGVTTYRPQGTPFTATSWQRVIDALGDLVEQLPQEAFGDNEVEPAFFAVAPLVELLRQPVITEGLEIPDAVLALRQLKEIRAQYLPDRTGFLLQKASGKAELQAALGTLLPWLSCSLGSGEKLLHALLSLAEAQPVEDDATTQLATAMRDACTALLDMGARRLSPQGSLLLLNKQLSTLAVRDSREGAELSFNGWLELLYSPAERLVIAGMHDNQIPERWPVSPLLTRAARQELGIRSDEDRAARDAFLLRAILGSRHAGDVCFTFSLTDIRKDPAAPSPLLFTLCPKDKLPEVVDHFFGKDANRIGSPSPAYDMSGWHYLPLGSVSGGMTAQQAASLSLADLGLPNPMHGKTFSPSTLADFLACPLRFWLKRVRHIKDDDADDERETLQQRNVGDNLHRVLEIFVRQYPSWEEYASAHPGVQPTNAQESVQHELLELFRTTYEQEYGTSPLLPQQVQKENMAARLSAYAAIHTQLWADGWHTARDADGHVMVEYQVDWEWQGHRLRMKIDRVDERINAEGKRELLIIDYKTGKVESCSKKHLAALRENALPPSVLYPDLEPAYAPYNRKPLEPHRWVELQLPLYSLWARQQLPPADKYGAAYIILDRKPEASSLKLWQQVDKKERDLDDTSDNTPSLLESAAIWAKACMNLMDGGRCLVSAEQLGWSKPAYDLFAEATEHVSLSDLFLPETENH